MTWSSISRGLRPIQSVKTITWFSLRSGIASIGVLSIAKMPAIVSAAVRISTRKRLRIDSSMIFSIMSAVLEPCRALDSSSRPIGFACSFSTLANVAWGFGQGTFAAAFAADEDRLAIDHQL